MSDLDEPLRDPPPPLVAEQRREGDRPLTRGGRRAELENSRLRVKLSARSHGIPSASTVCFSVDESTKPWPSRVPEDIDRLAAELYVVFGSSSATQLSLVHYSRNVPEVPKNASDLNIYGMHPGFSRVRE